MALVLRGGNWPAAGPIAGNPTLVQHVSSAANPGGIAPQGQNFKLPLPNPVGAGNCIILAISYPHAATVTVTDNNGNMWPSTPTVSADAGVGGYVASVFVLPNANAGLTTIAVTFGALVLPFSYEVSEFYNVATVAPVSGTSSAAGASGASLATGAFTPTNNNSLGGNLVWGYFAISGGASQNPTSFVPGGSFNLLAGDIAWVNNQGFPHATQFFVQAASASINPSITATGDTDSFNCVAVSLKAANAGTAPPAGIRVGKVFHHTLTGVLPTSLKLHFPTIGNLMYISTVNSFSNNPISSVTDSDGGVWTRLTVASDEPQVFYSVNRTPNPNRTVTINMTGTATLSFRNYDIVGADASPFDVSSGLVSTNANGLSTISNAPSITPTQAPGLTINTMGIGQGPGLGVTSPAGAVWDLCTYPPDEPDSDRMENADATGHLNYSTTATQNWTWTITSQASNTVFATAVCFKGA